MTNKIHGLLEIDAKRGVIHFHADETGTTLLRICGLPTSVPSDAVMLDITATLVTVNWKGKRRVPRCLYCGHNPLSEENDGT